MAVAPRPAPFEILDLRQVRARALASLLAEEEKDWGGKLHWDYHPSVEMIRRHLDARSLPGYVALREGEVAGYTFFVYEDDKGLLGDLYVVEAFRGERPFSGAPQTGEHGVATTLLERALETLLHTPGLRRIEAQLLSFGLEPLEPRFAAHGFRCFPRLFFYKPLTPAQPGAPRAEEPPTRRIAGAELRAWEDGYFEPMAELIVVCYRNHLDSQINDHYGTTAGALRFLKNIVLFPGCGVFQGDCSLVALPAGGGPEPSGLLGAVLTSQVARGVGHITQICVRPEWQGRGLGRRLLEAALARLAAKGCHGVSLTVTTENRRAVSLYHGMGFEVIKEFSAYSRDLR
jgi:ribosomal protein S18 acetylase RimI-like enzyme